MASNLLPPNATPLERSLAGVADRYGDIDIDIGKLWNPATIPANLLPWLAWSLSTDHWDSNWSDDKKRAAVASAIDDQRHKGTRYSVERVLSTFDDLLQLVEWFEASPRLDPFTFEVRLPLVDADGIAGGTRVSADFARAIVADVSATKPVRAHFALVQQLELAAMPLPFAAAQAAGYRRLDLEARDADAGIPWHDLLQDENGEPLEDDDGNFIDGTAP